jgi:hypothetical protein
VAGRTERDVDGTILPFPPPPSGSVAGRTMQESVYDPVPSERRLPDAAPNILIILIDDAGPALPDVFGGDVHTPTLGRVYGDGIGYNRFHTTAMCSPTRASLLTGRNHHRVGNGQIAELANDWDGYSGMIPRSSALQAEVLKDWGYATAAFGKCTTRRRTRRRWRVRSRTGRPVWGSSTSTGSSVVRPRSTSRTWCATPPVSGRRRHQRRAIT